MKISIVTPVYNGEQYIEHCILSIKKQKFTNYEHIIIDGGSTDGTIDIIRKYEGTYPMRYISEPDEGMYDAICKGFDMADGDIMAWLNYDDMYMDNAFEIVNTVFEHSSVQWLTGMPQIYDSNGTVYYISRMIPVYFRWAVRHGYSSRGKFIQQESTFWRRDLWNRADAGRVIRSYKLAGDYWLWREFAKYAELRTVDVPLSGFRRHKGQLSENKDAYQKEIGHISIIKKIIGRVLLRSLEIIHIVFDSKRIIHMYKYYK
ncbi:MAG: glycosyltransferase [Blautia sp.]|nr:glycosyltransferase [Blautia sp.]MCM1201828.1 glycosyltransferase [Bacteroides fragilis]